jgi:hypothetical protein
MKNIVIILAALLLFGYRLRARQVTDLDEAFPPSDFILHDANRKEEKPRTVLGPMSTDKNGKVTGSFAVYGGLPVQVSSLSFISADGKLLAVGSTPGIIDIWDVEKRQKIRSFDYGATVALAPDGRRGHGWTRRPSLGCRLREATKEHEVERGQYGHAFACQS